MKNLSRPNPKHYCSNGLSSTKWYQHKTFNLFNSWKVLGKMVDLGRNWTRDLWWCGERLPNGGFYETTQHSSQQLIRGGGWQIAPGVQNAFCFCRHHRFWCFLFSFHLKLCVIISLNRRHSNSSTPPPPPRSFPIPRPLLFIITSHIRRPSVKFSPFFLSPHPFFFSTILFNSFWFFRLFVLCYCVVAFRSAAVLRQSLTKQRLSGKKMKNKTFFNSNFFG